MPKPKVNRRSQSQSAARRVDSDATSLSRLNYELANNALANGDAVFASMIAASAKRIDMGWMTVRDACTFLQVCETTLRRLVKKSGINVYRAEYSNVPLYRTSDIEGLLIVRATRLHAAQSGCVKYPLALGHWQRTLQPIEPWTQE